MVDEIGSINSWFHICKDFVGLAVAFRNQKAVVL